MFTDLFNEIRLFFRGPIIKHHNKPLPPFIKEFILKNDNIDVNTDCYFVNSTDKNRYYVEFNPSSDNQSCFSSSVLMGGKEILITMVPKIMDDTATVGDVIDIMLSVLLLVTEKYKIGATSKNLLSIKSIAIPTLYFILLKDMLGDNNMIDCKTAASYYNKHINKLIAQLAIEDSDISNYKVISEKFFEKLNDLFRDYSENNDFRESRFSDFIYKMIDCSFISFETDVLNEF